MLRVRESLQATRACAVEHDSHDVVSECGSGKTALKNEESEVGSGEHDSHDVVSECSSGKTALKVQGQDVSSGSCHPVRSCCRCGRWCGAVCRLLRCEAIFAVAWRWVVRVPGGGRGSKVGFPVRPKICVLSQRWRQG